MKFIKISSLMFFSVLFSVCLFIGIEVFLYIVSPKYDRLSDILRIIEQDSVLFWKQKSNLNTVFQNQNLNTNSLGLRSHEIKDKSVKRIICMGASPTFGWGVKYEDTYPMVIGKIISDKGFNVETINAGQIGYSSYQGVKLFSDMILSLKPDIITVSYVINDIDKYRFFRNSSQRDSQVNQVSKSYIFINNILNRSKIFSFIRRIVMKNQSNKTKFYGSKHSNGYNENRRVNMEEYENNLNEILNIAEKNNIKVVFIVMPVNLPSKKELNEDENSKLATFIDSLKSEVKNNNYIMAKMFTAKILEIDKYNSIAYYYMAVIAENNKDYQVAEKLFEISKNFEIFDCAYTAKQYNEIMRQIAKKRNIPLCDSANFFVEYKKDYLFVDPKLDCFHPNAKGHQLIAEKLYGVIAKLLQGNKN